MWLQPSFSTVYYLAWLAQSAVTHQPSHVGQGLIVSMPTPLSPGDRAGAHLAVGTTEHELLSQVQELVHLRACISQRFPELSIKGLQVNATMPSPAGAVTCLQSLACSDDAGCMLGRITLCSMDKHALLYATQAMFKFSCCSCSCNLACTHVAMCTCMQAMAYTT